jgi:hypothetical protein
MQGATFLSTCQRRDSGSLGALASQQSHGETASFDDIGRLLASIYGIQYGALFETRHHAGSSYGLESKKDLVNALRKYCQFGGVWQGTCSLRKM